MEKTLLDILDSIFLPFSPILSLFLLILSFFFSEPPTFSAAVAASYGTLRARRRVPGREADVRIEGSVAV